MYRGKSASMGHHSGSHIRIMTSAPYALGSYISFNFRANNNWGNLERKLVIAHRNMQ